MRWSCLRRAWSSVSASAQSVFISTIRGSNSSDAYTQTNTSIKLLLVQGGHKVGEKNSKFSRLFQSHKLTFVYVIATKSKCNNGRHQGSFHVNSSNTTGHHRTLTSSLFLMILFIQSTAVLRKHLKEELKTLCYNFFPEVAQNSQRIPRVFHVQRNLWVFQVCLWPPCSWIDYKTPEKTPFNTVHSVHL